MERVAGEPNAAVKLGKLYQNGTGLSSDNAHVFNFHITSIPLPSTTSPMCQAPCPSRAVKV